MVDFHTHILPGMDDGSRSVEESVSMLLEEGRQGVSVLAATPHFYADQNSPEEFLKRRNAAWAELSPRLEPQMPQVLLGAEVQYFEGICAVEAIGSLRIQGTDLLLLEMPFCRWSKRMMEDVRQLNSRPDARVLLAHIDRYFSLQPRETLDWLVHNGVLLQANTAALASWRTRTRILHMLEHGQLHALGSDCHNLKDRRPNWDGIPKKAISLAEQGTGNRMLGCTRDGIE